MQEQTIERIIDRVSEFEEQAGAIHKAVMNTMDFKDSPFCDEED